MTKIMLAAILVGAFLYAVWLVALRRAPDARGSAGRRRIFLLMTLYFMAWMGVPSPAGEVAGMPHDGVAGVPAGENAPAPSAALRESWAILGMLNRGYLVAVLGTDGEREAYRDDKARYDETRRAFEEKSAELSRKMRKLEFCETCWEEARSRFWLPCEHETPEQRENRLARHKEAKKEYEKYVALYEKSYRDMQDRLSKRWWTEHSNEEKYLDRNRKLFARAVAEERSQGRLSDGAAALLKMAYDNLEYHSRRLQATCYMGLPPEYQPRENIGATIRSVAEAAAGGRLDGEKFSEAKAAVARDLAALHRLKFENEYEYVPVYNDGGQVDGYEKPENMDREVAEKMRAPGLAEAIDETARTIVLTAREMPLNWGSKQD